MQEGDPQKSLVDTDIKEEIKDESKGNKNMYIVIGIVCFVVIIGIIILVLIFLSDDEEKKLKFLSWDEAHKKAKEKLKDFTIKEKLGLLYGTHNMEKKTEDGGCVANIDPVEGKFGGICLQDGPAGVRFSTSTQSWQTAINTVSTFNKTLMYEVGKAQGKEFREKGVHIALTPGMNIQRSPQGGRLWESFGDDPFLAGEAATQIIKGVQSNGVIACAKHYIANDQETDRRVSSSNIKEQAFYEIYFEPFYRSINDGEVGSIMAAYSLVNGTLCVKNKKIIQDILKDKFGYKGFVMSDWWAIVDNSTDNFNSGVDANMPGGKEQGAQWVGRDQSYWSDFEAHLGKEITYERLDDAVERILASMYKLDQFSSDNKYPKIDIMKDTITDKTKKINREAATQSNVLLKNKDDILPLKNLKGKKIAIIGNDAFPSPCIRNSDCSCKNDTNKIYQGHLALGFGSGTTYFNYLVDPLSAIKERAEKEGIEILTSGNITSETITIDGHTLVVGKEDLEGAKAVAEKADICIVFISADSGEQYIDLETAIGDRHDLDAWHSGNQLVSTVLETNKSVIVVINSPGPINVPWLDEVQGLIFSGLAGAESGNGIADILFGYYNPSGHLPYVWGKMEDYPAMIDIFSHPENLDYNEGVFVGQRYFEKNNKTYTFPFGYGLSYTTFEFLSDSLNVEMTKEGLKVKFSVKNSGKMEGETVPMVFLKFPDTIKSQEGYPDKLFKGFDKKWVKPNESVQFEILVDDHALSYYDIFQGKFVRPKEGKYTVFVGFDADNFDKLETEVDAGY